MWINDDEIALLKQRNVGISNNPESNMKLSSGTAPVVAYRKAGVNVGLGTDGAASNNDLDMFEAMRQAAFQQKLITMDPTAISAPEALEMATIGGARVLGQQARIGSLEPGKRADVIIVGMSQAASAAAVRSGRADRLCVARRRRRDDDREREGADARSKSADARRVEGAERGPRRRGPRAEGRQQ